MNTIIITLVVTFSTVRASDPFLDDLQHPAQSVPALGLLNSGGDGDGNVGHTLGVNPLNLDHQGHIDVQLTQLGVDPMLVGPNYRLGNLLKLEGGPFGPIGGPLNPHVGPYYGMKGHRFHSSHQADRILSGTEGPLPAPLIPSPLIHPFATNQYSNPLTGGLYSPGPGYGYVNGGGFSYGYGSPLPYGGAGTGTPIGTTGYPSVALPGQHGYGTGLLPEPFLQPNLGNRLPLPAQPLALQPASPYVVQPFAGHEFHPSVYHRV